MKTFDKKSVTALSKEIEKALGVICKKHGLLLEMKGGRFDATDYIPKINIRTKKTSSYFDDLKEYYPDLASKKIKLVIANKPYTIFGLDRSRRKKNIILTDKTGATFFTTPEVVYKNIVKK